MAAPTVAASSNSDCFIDDTITTCNISASYSLTIDLKTPVQSLPNYDLVQIDGLYHPFKPQAIIASLRSRSNLSQVVDRFKLRLVEDLDPRISSEGPYPYSFEAIVNNDPPRLTDLRTLVEKSGVSGKYRFFTNSGANTYLTALEMRGNGREIGVIVADLNKSDSGSTRKDSSAIGAINASASPD